MKTIRESNIVQAEFCHVGAELSLQAVFDEIEDRAQDGMRAKTCVRFYDQAGAMTKFIAKCCRVHDKHERFFQRLTRLNSGWRRRRLSRECQKLAGKELQLAEEARLLAVRLFVTSIKIPEQTAKEVRDFFYEFIPANEVHDIVEAVSASKSVKIFVFEPNELLADTLSSVADFGY